MTYQKCKAPECGKAVVYATDHDGKTIPLDPKAAVYAVKRLPDGSLQALLMPKDKNGKIGFLVSHFATCKRPEQFSAEGGRER